MAIFEERTPRKCTAFLFLFAVFVLSWPLWHLGEREMFWHEGKYACVSGESTNSFPPLMTAHGQMEPGVYPLYPLLVNGLTRCGLPIELSLRAITVFSLFLLTLIVYFACCRAGGIQAGLAGATVMFTTLLTAEKAMEGYPQMLTALILYGGWMLWFELALVRNRWDLAWLIAGVFGSLAFYAAGYPGLISFLLPLALQQRPLNVWTKLRHPGLPIAIGMVVFTILFYYAPQWDQQMPSGGNLPGIKNWMEHVLMFPVTLVFRFLPWSLLLWAPFCAALIPLDQNPLFGKYLRVLFYVMLCLLWLNVNSSARDLLYIAPLIATMIGANYWILVRRYGYLFLSVCRIFGWLLLVLAGISVCIYHYPATLEFPDKFFGGTYMFCRLPVTVFYVEIGLAVLAILWGLWRCRYRPRVWQVYASLFCGMMLLYWTMVNPYRASMEEKRDFGNKLQEVLTKDKDFAEHSDAFLYKDSAISGLFAECYYMDLKVQTMAATENFAEQGEFVYVLSPGVPPAAERFWTRLYDTVYKDKHLYLYKGQLRKDDYDYDEEYGDD